MSARQAGSDVAHNLHIRCMALADPGVAQAHGCSDDEADQSAPGMKTTMDIAIMISSFDRVQHRVRPSGARP
jgi:hypothetical protein